MMAELEKTVRGLQAGTAADSQKVSQIRPPSEIDRITVSLYLMLSISSWKLQLEMNLCITKPVLP